MHKSISLLMLAFLSVGAVAARQIVPLSDARNTLKLPNYSSKDRETLANQADLMISNLYVHRELKVNDFGADADPVPKLADLKARAKDMSNEDFHRTIAGIFNGLHDLHTNYFAPAPTSCGLVFVPLRFTSVKDGESDVVVVSQILQIKEDLTKDINVGDRLLQVNGESVENVLATLEKDSGGSNADAMRQRATQMLSFRMLMMQAAPSENSLKLTLAGPKGSYQKEIPWQALYDEECVSGTELKFKRNFNKDDMNIAEDEYQRHFNRVFGQPALVRPIPTNDDDPLKEIFEVALLNTPAGAVGYVRLKSFHWTDHDLDIATIVEGLRNSIETYLNTAVGLVIDVRGNGGGHIVLAEKLAQLFSTKEVEPTTVRMIPNALNEKIFLKANGRDNRWSEAIRNAEKTQAKYTSPLAITPLTEANSEGQVWFKPVVVLTDASCFSACDLFTASMQDSGAGVLIGVHHSTGGGGANVMEYNTFRTIMGDGPENPFVELPFEQNMRVSWRQSIRSGLHNGELIEDKGVQSDIVIPLTRADVGSESKELMRKIHEVLVELIPKYESGLGVIRGGVVILPNGSPAKWKEQVYGVDSVETSIEGQLLATQSIVVTSEKREVEFSAPLTGGWTDRDVVIVGKREGKPVFRSVRELMWRGDYTEIPKDGISVDFKKGLLPFRTVQLRGARDAGWQIVNGSLRVGKGPLYDPNVLARAYLPLNLKSQGARVTLDISLQAEDLNDTLRIYAVNPVTGERFSIYAGSEIPEKKGVTLVVPSGWDKADVVFEFESDENWNMEGPLIGNVKISN